ncbi:TPA: DsbC family protein [Citrobacter freundii]|nr:DsbC family protein [Citrobacter freundii]
MNFKKATVTAALMMSMGCGFAHAQNDKKDSNAANTSPTEMSVKEAQDKLSTSFSGLNISSFKESPISGIFEVRTGSNTIYFYPPKEDRKGVLIFGEMYDESGKNLTQESKMAGLSDSLKSLPLNSAITIGPKNAPVVYEFTDPDCPYCHSYDNWIKTYSKGHPVQRKLIFFNNPSHPLALAKMKHVICSDDKEAAYRYVFSEELPHDPDAASALQMEKQAALKTCKEADEVLSKHAEIIKATGVNGTPAFLFNVDTKPNLIVGFDQSKIAEAILDMEKAAATQTNKSSK